jgi:hypothetical protein
MMTCVCGDGGWKSFRYGYSCLDLLERERRTRELSQEKEVRGCGPPEMQPQPQPQPQP